MKMLNLINILITITVIVGCVPKKVIEDLGIITAIGFDVGQENEEMILLTTVFFQFDPDVANASQIIENEARTLSEIKHINNKTSMHQIVPGQLRVMVLSSEIAQTGVIRLLDYLIRNAEVPNNFHIAVASGRANDLLKVKNYEEAPNIGAYLDKLLTNAVTNEKVVSSTMHEFLRNFYNPGRDAIVPLLNIKEDRVVIDGVGVFSNDQYVGSFPLEDIFYVRLVMEKFKSGEMTIALPNEKFQEFKSEHQYHKETEQLYVAITQISSSTEIKLTDPNLLSFEVNINYKGNITEVNQLLSLEDPQLIKLLEKEVEKHLVEKITEIINQSKELRSDIFGFGEVYEASVRKIKLNKEDWHAMMPDIKVDVKAQVKISNYGTID